MPTPPRALMRPSRLRRALWSLLCLLCAHAHAGAIQLDYLDEAGGARCPDGPWLERRVEGLLGRAIFAEDGERWIVRLAAMPPGLKARLEVEGGGARVLSTPTRDCLALVDAVAFSMVVALDPIQAMRLEAEGIPPASMPASEPTSQPASQPTSKPTSQPASQPTSQPTSAPVALPVEPWAWRLHLDVTLGDGADLQPVVTGQAGARAGLGPWWLGLEARINPMTTRDARGGELRGRLIMGALSGCRRWGWAEGCGLLQGGLLLAEGAGYRAAQSTAAPHLAPGARLGALWPVLELGARSLDLRLWIEGAIPLSRTRLRIDDHVVWESAAVTGALGLGLELAL